jgi:hypothetical protein
MMANWPSWSSWAPEVSPGKSDRFGSYVDTIQFWGLRMFITVVTSVNNIL